MAWISNILELEVPAALVAWEWHALRGEGRGIAGIWNWQGAAGRPREGQSAFTGHRQDSAARLQISAVIKAGAKKLAIVAPRGYAQEALALYSTMPLWLYAIESARVDLGDARSASLPRSPQEAAGLRGVLQHDVCPQVSREAKHWCKQRRRRSNSHFRGCRVRQLWRGVEGDGR